MDNNELLQKIQAVADQAVAEHHRIRTAELSLVHIEDKEDNTKVIYALGADMPNFIYRIFYLDAEGNVTEETAPQKAAELSAHFNRDIKPTLKLVPPFIEETGEYEIVLENRLENRGVEVKLKSSTGRDVTMIEVYRYYDYKSKLFLVACIGLSFPGQYVFAVMPDNKHIRLIITNDENIRNRLNMINELLMARVLPSYRTIADAGRLLTGDAKVRIDLNDKDNKKATFTCQFVYDDDQTQSRFAFFRREDNPQEGVVLVQDIFNGNRLSLSNVWTPEQREAAERITNTLKEHPEEIQKGATSFFADNLDFRYKAYKDGKLTPETIAEAEKAANGGQQPA